MAANGGTKVSRAHFSFVVLSFGFLVLYNLLSWFPVTNIVGAYHLGDLKLNLALPAGIAVFVIWAASTFVKGTE